MIKNKPVTSKLLDSRKNHWTTTSAHWRFRYCQENFENRLCYQRTFAYFKRGSITVHLISCSTGLDLAEQVNLFLIKQKQSSWIQTSQTRGQPYSDTFLKIGHSRPLFSLFSSFLQTVNSKYMFKKVADDWIRTRVLWYRKQPLCQLRHNHCPGRPFIT